MPNSANLSKIRWRRLAIASMAVAGVQAVVIGCIVLRVAAKYIVRWMG